MKRITSNGRNIKIPRDFFGFVIEKTFASATVVYVEIANVSYLSCTLRRPVVRISKIREETIEIRSGTHDTPRFSKVYYYWVYKRTIQISLSGYEINFRSDEFSRSSVITRRWCTAVKNNVQFYERTDITVHSIQFGRVENGKCPALRSLRISTRKTRYRSVRIDSFLSRRRRVGITRRVRVPL